MRWYGMPLEVALSWRGIFRVGVWNLLHRQRDEIPRDYGVLTVFDAAPPGDGREAPAPTVWHCPTLTARRNWTEVSEVASLLEEHVATIRDEFLRLQDHLTIADCPRTTALLQELPLTPTFGSVRFSVLTPGVHTDPHAASSNLRLRHLLALDIPGTEGGTLAVAGEVFRWRPGECFALDDSYRYEVTCGGQGSRAVLIVDTWHPDLTSEDRGTLAHPLFATFGRVDAPVELGRLAHEALGYLRDCARSILSELTYQVRGVQRHLWAGEQDESLTRLFHVVNEFLSELEIEYWISWGTLLAYHRGGSLLAGDPDVDFGARAEDYPKVLEAAIHLPKGFTLRDTSHKHGGPKVYVEHQGWCADIYFHRESGGLLHPVIVSRWEADSAPFPPDQILPTEPATFLGAITRVPARIEAHLRHCYGCIDEGARRDPRTGYFLPSGEASP
jgi:hypothetical protein